MTDKPGTPSNRHRGAPMNRMMPDNYEKRAMTTAHLRQTLAAREGQGASPNPSEVASAPTQSSKPRADG